MAIKDKLFIDTSFFCAFYNKNGSQFEKSTSYIELLNNKKVYTSNFVLLESYTIISQRVSRKAAIDFGNTIQNMPEIKIIKVDQEIEYTSWEIFQIVSDKNMSYVDCSIIATMKEHGISHLLTFDSQFKKHSKQFKFKLV